MDIQRDGQTAPLTHRVVHLEIEQVEGASLALQQVLGLLDDGGHQPLKTHLFLEEAPGEREEKLEEEKHIMIRSWNANLRGRLSTVELLIKVACFVKA